MVRSVLVVAIVLLALTGCGSRPGAARVGEVRAPDPRARGTVRPVDAAAVRAGNAAFGGRLLGWLARSEPTVALSPLSISEALAMTFAGARGDTAAQMARALDFRLPPARLHAAFNALDQALGAVNGAAVTLSVANALYGQRGTRFREGFLGVLARDYGAGMGIVDFEHAADAAIAAINAWVSDRTRGKIPRLLGRGDVDELTRLVLVNAVYLNAKWQAPFQKRATSPAPFHAPDGTVQVPTMHQTATFGYLRGEGYRALELPYRGGRLAFDVLLPDRGRLPALVRRLAGGDPLDAVRGLRPQRVQLALPKLLLRSRFELADALKALGMPLAFDLGAPTCPASLGGQGISTSRRSSTRSTSASTRRAPRPPPPPAASSMQPRRPRPRRSCSMSTGRLSFSFKTGRPEPSCSSEPSQAHDLRARAPGYSSSLGNSGGGVHPGSSRAATACARGIAGLGALTGHRRENAPVRRFPLPRERVGVDREDRAHSARPQLDRSMRRAGGTASGMHVAVRSRRIPIPRWMIAPAMVLYLTVVGAAFALAPGVRAHAAASRG